MTQSVDALVLLAGGRGSRLGAITDYVAKPALCVGRTPFIKFLVLYIRTFFKGEIIVLSGYQSWSIERALDGLDVSVFVEEQPLGTGGAIKNLRMLRRDLKSIVCINGDTFVVGDFCDLFRNLGSLNFAIVGKQMSGTRYGRVVVDSSGRVSEYGKGFHDAHPIHLGITKLELSVFDEISELKFDLEEFLMARVKPLRDIWYYNFDSEFIDIGVPKDLERVQAFLKKNGIKVVPRASFQSL